MQTKPMDTAELKKKFDQLYNQILEINILSKDLLYLHPKKNIYNERIYASSFMNRIIDGLKCKFALRFCNILNSNEDYNLISFVDYIISEFDSFEFNNSVELDKIKEVKTNISKIKKSVQYKVIYHIRNKHLAHIDKDRSSTNLPTVIQEDVDQLINEIIDLFTFLGNHLFEINYHCNMFREDRDHNLLHQLSTYWNISDVCDEYIRNNEAKIDVSLLDKMLIG